MPAGASTHPDNSSQIEAPASPAARDTPAYLAPALDKGLDILELLSGEELALTPHQIASRLSRSTSEIFRMLETLQRRGYLVRTQPGGAYRVTLKLFELGNRQSRLRRLLDSALPRMNELARQTLQSNHLVVHHDRRILVVAQADSPEALSFAVRLGAHFEFGWRRVSARILTAFQADPQMRAQLIGEMVDAGPPCPAAARLVPALNAIRRAGYDRRQSGSHFGIIDIGAPIFDHTGEVIASLSQPFFRQPNPPRDLEHATTLHREIARAISADLGMP